MEKKEFYRLSLPHFQQSIQSYFVTWCLKDAVLAKALPQYTEKLYNLRSEINILKKNKANKTVINQVQMEYYLTRKKFIKAYDDLLHLQQSSIVNLSKESNREIIIEALTFWEGEKLENYAFCIMSNHVHWVFKIYEKDNAGQIIYLQDIMQSIKRFTANKLNKLENRTGNLWHKESFDTTIRDEKHLFNAINYTINYPVEAKLVPNWEDWKGTRLFDI